MAAIMSISEWIPEDDLLLKNAVEAGASLEALAKGAVRFSRKFSVRELRDRWRALLYDPEIAAEASARMIEFELSASTNNNNNSNSSKFVRLRNPREAAEPPAKRKAQSIRKQYYAMRKRIRSQSSDLTFFCEQNGDDCIVDHGGCQNRNELPVGNHILGDCVSNHFKFKETGINSSHHIYPDVSRDSDAINNTGSASNRSHSIDPNSIVDRKPNRIVREEGNDGLTGQLGSLPFRISIKEEDSHSLEQDSIMDRDTSVDLQNRSNVDEIGLSHELQDNNTSLHLMGASSPQPGMPLWKTIEDVSAPAMPVSVSLGDINHGSEQSLIHHGVDGKKKNSSSYHSELILNSRYTCDGINSSTAFLESDFDLPDSLLDFPAEEELLFIDVDSKDPMDKSCYDSLNSLILNSPNDVPEDVSPDVCENQTLISTTRLPVPDAPCEGTADLTIRLHDNQHYICSEDVNVPQSTSTQNSCPPKLDDGIMICTLNTEDPEIPYNDDFISPVQLASPVTQPSYKQAGNLIPSLIDKRNTALDLSLMKKEKLPVHSLMVSPMFGPDMLPETIPNHRPVSCGVKSEFPDGSSSSLITRPADDAEQSQCRLIHATPNSSIDLATRENTLQPCNATVSRLPHADAGLPFPDHEAVPSTSDQEESESDDDIPNYLDIEAMILDMDLCPDEDDLCFSKKVLMKLHEDKRPVIRLEQCYGSSKQREIASKGAFALLYGHKLRHYIKKTEVILGRATEDFDVDIDLRREGPANKISRRQALIRMEEDSSFLLKNLGKGSIFLNGIEVATGQHLILTSNSLIEVKDMAFVFEINHKYVRHYLANVARKNQEKHTSFAWLPEGGPD